MRLRPINWTKFVESFAAADPFGAALMADWATPTDLGRSAAKAPRERVASHSADSRR